MDVHRLLEIIEAAGLEPMSYSGRGMMGQRCVGLLYERLTTTLAKIIRECASPSEASDLVWRSQADSPILYWPHTIWVDGMENEIFNNKRISALVDVLKE